MLRPLSGRQTPGPVRGRSIADGHSLARRAVVEGLGTAFLLAVVVGSGIMAERLAAGNDAVLFWRTASRPARASSP